MEMTNVQRRTGDLRRAIVDGRAVDLTFHGQQYATVLPTNLLDSLLELAGDAGRQLLDETREGAAA
jgi:hypothetical protein